MALAYRGPFLLVYAVSHLTERLLEEHLAGSGLTPGEFAAYSLVNAEGQITPTRMSSLLGIPPTTVSYLVRQMTARGHLRRLPNPDDGRSTLVELTPAGRRVTQQATRGFARAIETFREHLSIPEAHVLSSLEAMAGALEQAIETTAAVERAG